MRLILSRKGFDSSSGGCPNPVFPDGTAVSLPIPDRQSPIRYSQVRHRGRSIGTLVRDLTRGKLSSRHGAHLDPDLIRDAYPRDEGWRPVLGQHGQAQSHLMGQGVCTGDLFLFFALFRYVEWHQGRWRFVPGSRSFHALWGWLQVGQVMPLDGSITVPGWAGYHPHLSGDRGVHNTLYLSADRLLIEGLGQSLPAAGVFDRMTDAYRLTAPDASRVTEWILPDAFFPSNGRLPMSYHHNLERWQPGNQGLCTLRSAARGQEFVLDLDVYPEVYGWLAGLFEK